jgi:site-specific DNA-methyltransferase (adenine-specific)
LLSTYGGVMSEPCYVDEAVTLYHGDCRKVMASFTAASVDAIVTDPPYELGFMGKRWDASGIAYDEDVWAQAHRVLKPGGHLLAFGGTRTWHRLAVAIEDAGFEIRDSIAWMYGSGFPKSLDVSKAIDKGEGHWRGKAGAVVSSNSSMSAGNYERTPKGDPITRAAQQWQGWGTALKPAFEPVVVARKPLDGTVAENVLRHDTGALNIDGSRIGTELLPAQLSGDKSLMGGLSREGGNGGAITPERTGRWPANVILDESQAAELDRQSGVSTSVGIAQFQPRSVYSADADGYDITGTEIGYGDTGGASRFFYVPKANANERPRDGDTAHPTVKPLDLMRYLVKLVTPPGGTVLEPFAGSGTTLEACVIEGFNVIGIELTEDYLPLIMQRITKPIEVTLL